MNKRVFFINNKSIDTSKKYVLYCMEASQRIEYNYALFYAIKLADELKKPLLVVFNITDSYKHSNLRYYKFMIEGIIKLRHQFKELGIRLLINKNTYKNGCKTFLKDASAVIVDKNYLKTQNSWREYISAISEVGVFEIESDVVVPVRIASDKQEPYAMTIRPKIFKLMDYFLEHIEINPPKIKSLDFDYDEFYFDSVDKYLENLNIDKSVKASSVFIGGTDEANKRLKDFINNKLYHYKDFRSDPSKDYQSNLSPYIHFGQISPVYIINEILKNYDKEDENVKSFLNELVVWRELARNFCFYNKNYNKYEGVPEWARKSLEEHLSDKREYIYSIQKLENAQTHDIYWNAAQKELLISGKMHNYMRMYWAKKLIEWTSHPKEAFDIACYLNDKYELDGRDPNAYAGISWNFGTFDRPWAERPIFGKIRYMNDKGLERKFDIKSYARMWSVS